MHRILPNLLFILILFILATAFPLSVDILSLDLSQKIVDKPVEEIVIDPELSPLLPSNSDSIVNETITFDIESSTNAFPTDYLSGFSLQISRQGKIVKTVPVSSLSIEAIDASAKSKTINISKADLFEGLTPGYYTCALTFEDQTLEYNWYISNNIFDKTLLKTTNQIGAKQLSLTIFYPTYDYKNVVPITRHETTGTNRWRTLYSSLFNGPKAGLGLYEGVPAVPRSPNIQISKNIASIYINSKDLIGFEDKFPIVIDSVTKTFMSQGIVEGVKFLIDNSTTNTTLGVDLTQTYMQSSLNHAYTGYSHASPQMMLMPIPLSTTVFEDRVKEAWEVMRHNSSNTLYTADMIQSVPSEIDLIDFKLDGTLLTLDVSPSIVSLLDQAPEYKDLMFKSILYTYVSFPEVETIQITTNGAPLISGTYDFTQPVKPDLYINMQP